MIAQYMFVIYSFTNYNFQVLALVGTTNKFIKRNTNYLKVKWCS